MSNIRILAPSRARQQTTPMPQDLRLGRIMSDEEIRTAMRRGRRMQALAVARFFMGFARWLRGNPASRSQRVSNAMSAAGR